MSNAPLMPMATAVWLVENTSLTFRQIANFCKLHEVEIQGIADGEVGKGIKAYNPIISGQLSREEIELSSKDENRPLLIKNNDIEILNGDINKSIMIGDSETDANAAKAAEIPIILLKYGYTEKRSNEIYHNHLVKDFIGIEKIVSEYL